MAVVYRRRWPALVVFATVFGLLLARSFRTTPTYEATARILIEADTPNVVSFEDVVETNRRTLDYFQTQYRLLASRALAQRALEMSGLINERAFQSKAHREEAANANPLDAVRAFFSRQPEPREADTESLVQDRSDSPAVRRFLNELTVTPVRNSRLVDVTFTSTDRVIAQRGANAIVN